MSTWTALGEKWPPMQIRHEQSGECLQFFGSRTLWRKCDEKEPSQMWGYLQRKQQLVTFWLDKCLELDRTSTFSGEAVLRHCDASSVKKQQSWSTAELGGALAVEGLCLRHGLGPLLQPCASMPDPAAKMTSTEDVSQDEIYYMKSVNSGFYLNTIGNLKGADATSKTFAPKNATSAQWIFESRGLGMWGIKNSNTRLYLNVQGSFKKDGGLVWEWDNPQDNATLWRLVARKDGSFNIMNVHSGLYLEADAGVMSGMHQVDDSESRASRWELYEARDSCKWLTDSGKANVLECVDGSSCNMKSSGEDCCGDHDGRAKCPANLPRMCSAMTCEGDYCCKADCSSMGSSARGCAPEVARLHDISSSSHPQHTDAEKLSALSDFQQFIVGNVGLGDITLPGYNCWHGNGGEAVNSQDMIGVMKVSECKRRCEEEPECEGVVYYNNQDYSDCWLRRGIDVGRCMPSTAWDLWIKELKPDMRVPSWALPPGSTAETRIAPETRTCPGAIQVEGYGPVKLVNAIFDMPGMAATKVEVSNASGIVPHMRGRTYFADACQDGVYDHNAYAAMKLIGKTLRYSVDLSAAGCGCNAALYMTSLHQESDVSGCNDYYCDANSVCGLSCPEIDIMEANRHAFYAHDGGGHGAGYGATHRELMGKYAPGGSCIDTNKPFQVEASFPMNATTGTIRSMEVKLSQAGKKCHHSKVSVAGYWGNAELTTALQQGMTPIISYWGVGENMMWMDGPGSDGGGPCDWDDPGRCGESVRFFDFALLDHQDDDARPSTVQV